MRIWVCPTRPKHRSLSQQDLDIEWREMLYAHRLDLQNSYSYVFTGMIDLAAQASLSDHYSLLIVFIYIYLYFLQGIYKGWFIAPKIPRRHPSSSH